jgi:excisionase family DNA binding protein
MTIAEAAEFGRAHQDTIRRAIDAGELSAVFGSQWLLTERDLRLWLEARANARLRKAGGLTQPQARRRASRRADMPGSVARLQAMDSEAA